MICTFFGHKDTPDNIRFELKKTLEELIKNEGADIFYVGNQGRFDNMVRYTLTELRNEYPHIKYYVVLAYLPQEDKFPGENIETIYPEGLETTPPKYAISKRNKWLVEHSDTVITYVIHSWGGAAQFKELAEKKGKRVINLYK